MSEPVCLRNNMHLLIPGTFLPRGSWRPGGGKKTARQSKCPKVEYSFFLVCLVAPCDDILRNASEHFRSSIFMLPE